MTATQPRAEEVTSLPAQDRPAPRSNRPHRRRSAPTPRGIFGGIGKYGSLIVACLFALVPIMTILMLAFKTSAEYRSTGPLDPPSNWLNFDNFVIAFSQGGMVLGFINTGIILVVSIFGTVIIGTMAAYAIDRFRFRGRRMITALFLLATLVPAVTTQVATFQVINALELFNTRWSAILLFTGTDIVAIYIFLQFMQSIPVALDEAAMLDGASRFTVYRRIILPLLKPAIATVVIIKGIAVYNEFYIPFLYMPSRDLGVISTSLFRFMGPFGAQWEVIAAGTILVIVPTLVAFLFLQRFIYNGLTSGATK
ncbi:carbohydrate ABC transporter permease [Clavibacter michiganensis]|nr:carbohydrate ABC transporter permease [Clavibacter michiganensis]